MFSYRNLPPLNFDDNDVATRIRRHIECLDGLTNRLKVLDPILSGSIVPLAVAFPYLGICMGLVYSLVAREFLKKNINAELKTLSQFFLRVRPQDTSKAIVIELTNVLVPLIVDETILTQWFTDSNNSPMMQIDAASEEFKTILRDKGFLDVRTFNTFDEVLQAEREKTHELHTSFQTIFNLLKKKIYFCLYGQGDISRLLESNNVFIYYSRSRESIAALDINNRPEEVPQGRVSTSFSV